MKYNFISPLIQGGKRFGGAEGRVAQMEEKAELADLELLTEEQVALLPSADPLDELEELPAAGDDDELEELDAEDDGDAAVRLPPYKPPLLLRLTRRAVIFLFLLLGTLLSFYIAGCAQGFLDKDLLLLLFCCTAVSVLLLLFSACAAAECVIFLFTQRRLRFLPYLLAFAVVGAIAAVAAVVSHSIHLLANGI